MVHCKSFRVAANICLLSLCAAPLFGQATFTVASAPATAADIGVTELTGQIILTVQSGQTVSAPFQIQYSAQVTNNNASEISVTGTGGLAGIAHAPTLAGSNAIVFTVPAGGTSGNLIRIQGVRVALAGHDYTGVTASISSPSGGGNGITAGQNTVTVIGLILQPLDVDFSGSESLAYRNGVVTHDESSFVVQEGFTAAFTSSVGTFGQTVPTGIRITPYPDIPAGAKVTFSATATSDLGSVLTTTSGLDETIPGDDGSTSVVYKFTGASSSPTQMDSFTISVSMAQGPAAGTGIIDFQAALVPIGIATPDASSPSTDIPRYWERIIPDPSELPGLSGSTELAFPFRSQSDATYTAFALTNPLDYRVNVTLTPYDASGSAITNSITLTIPQNGQIAKLATDTDVFGPTFNASTAGTIRAVGTTPTLAGFYLLGDVSGSRLDGDTADLNSVRNWVWPVVFRQAPAPFTTFEMFNPGTATAVAVLTLFDSNGTTISTSSRSIGASGTVTQSFQQLFPGVDLNSFAGGYVKGQSDAPLVAKETFGNSLDSNVLPGQVGQSSDTLYWPHFASGGGYTTELTLIDLDSSVNANLTVTLLDSNGISIGQASLSIPHAAQTIQTIASLFPALPVSQVTTGYIRIDFNPTHLGPFIFMPLVAGSLRFSAADGSGSAALPLVTSPVSDFVYSHVAETAGYWTGVAILNTHLTSATVSLEVFTKAGASVGTKSLTLLPGQKIAKLLYELVPAVAGQSGGYVHIVSDLPVTSFSLFGSYDGLSLSAIPPQDIGN